MFFGRGKNRIQKPYNISGMYKDYSESVEKNSPYDITYKEWMSILDDYFSDLQKAILEGKGVFKVPHNLGFISVVKRKANLSKLKRIDWKATVESGKRVYHLNEHSDGYNYIVKWERKDYSTKHSKYYAFQPVRAIKRTLAKLIKNKEFDTYEV